jgi:hypothetical protein
MFAVSSAVSLALVLVIALRLHFHSLVQTHCGNALTGRHWSYRNWMYDSEFWPSISAAIGDNMPERAIWRVTIAVMGGLFALSYVQLHRFYVAVEHDSKWRKVCTAVGVMALLRVVGAYGYTFIASFEQLFYHELSFAGYIVAGAGIQIMQVLLARRHQRFVSNGRGELSYKLKLLCLVGQTLAVCGVVKFFAFDHQACVRGAYSVSTMFEWTFAIFNLAFDATMYFELADMNIVIGTGGAGDHQATPTPVKWALTSAPAGLMWAAEIVLGYVFVGSFLQMVQQVYFIPMVAMQFTSEVCLALTPPLVTLGLSFLPSVKHLAAGELTISQIVHLQKWLVGMGALSVLCLFHIDLVAQRERKIVLAAIGPHVLLPLFRVRSLAASAKVAVLSRRESEDGSAMLSRAAAEHFRLCYALPFGFVTSIILRWWGISLDPIFGDFLYNAFAIVVFCVVLFFGPFQQLCFDNAQLQPGSSERHTSPGTPQGGLVSSLFVGVLFGFTLMIASAPGTLARYVAVDPLTDWWVGLFVIGAFLSGILSASSIKIERVARHHTMLSALTVLSTAVLYYGTTQSNRYTQVRADALEDWSMEEFSGSPKLAFFGGLVLVFCLGVFWPHACAWDFGFSPDMLAGPVEPVATVSPTSPRSIVARDALVFFAVVAVIVAGVYTVCFPFVPGGFLMRDRMDIVLFSCAVAVVIAAGATRRLSAHGTRQESRHDRSATKDTSVRSVGTTMCACTLLVCVIRWIGFHDAGTPVPIMGKVEVTTAIWTIHFSQDNYGVDSMSRLTEDVRMTGANVVGLLESDMQRITNGNRDIVEYMAYHLGFPHTDYGPTTLDGTFGCALISRFPITEVKRMVLPSPMGELACLIHAKLNVGPGMPLFNVYVGHWGNTEHVQDLVLQSQILGQLALHNAGPSVFLGYLTTHVGYHNYYRMIQSDGEEEDHIMRVTNNPNRIDMDDGTKTMMLEDRGARLPRIPVSKQRTGLFRDCARDLLRGHNQLTVSDPRVIERHREARNVSPIDGPVPSTHYWKAYALKTPFYGDVNRVHTLVGDGATMSDELRSMFALTAMSENVQFEVEKDYSGFDHVQLGPEAASYARLQKAAEIHALHLTRGFHQGPIAPKAPAVLREDVDKIEKNGYNERTAYSVVYHYVNTDRVTQSHPRREYEDRYCQQMLYRDMVLRDWYRILDIDELSDTELQIGKFTIVARDH